MVRGFLHRDFGFLGSIPSTYYELDLPKDYREVKIGE
jgi:hypothetical protein